MNRIDRFLAFYILAVTAGVVFVFFCIIALGESLDSWRLTQLAKTRGDVIAMLSVVANSARWSVNALPVTALIGGIVALINLQRYNTLVVMKASGQSIWQILRGPVVAVTIAGIVISFFADAEVTKLARFIQPAPQVAGTSIGASNEIWIEQNIGDDRFIITAANATTGGAGLEDVTVFLGQDLGFSRIIAEKAEMQNGLWALTDVTIMSANSTAQHLAEYYLETDATLADLKLRLTSSSDLTFFELADALRTGLTDKNLLAAATTRFLRLLALPVMLIGTLLIAFAFTAGYRRSGSFGGTILYGIVLGFVMFAVNEMAERAGSAGVLTPGLAAWGPAIVTVVIGLTALLYREDGRV